MMGKAKMLVEFVPPSCSACKPLSFCAFTARFVDSYEAVLTRKGALHDQYLAWAAEQLATNLILK